MSNVLFITPGPIKWASSRLRAHWIAEGLEDASVLQYEYIIQGIEPTYRYDTVVFVKVADTKIVNLFREEGSCVIWDICDPVHWFAPDEARQMADSVDHITVSNTSLMGDFVEWWKPWNSEEPALNVHCIPDRIKLSHYPIQAKHKPTNHIRFIWFGAGQNRFTLMGALANLDRLKANGVDFSLTIYDDQPQNQWKASFPVYHADWELDQENEVLASHDIALIPPYPGAWGRVKSNNKILTAWACGLPVTDGEYFLPMYELATRVTQREISAHAGMETLKRHYLIEQSIQDLKGLLK